MDKLDRLPFKVGQVAESKSFQSGFRSAWFRCKINEISRKKGYTCHALEFFDFPDEKVKWTKLYQVPQYHGGKSKEIKRQLMVRPSYPPMFYESQMPDISVISEVTVIVDGVWKVGDLVDWWTDGCYWSATVTQILGKDKVQIVLPLPPVGEGMSYEVPSKDLRPSLDWSPEHGWRMPSPMGSENYNHCRLVKPVNQDSRDDLRDKSKRCRTKEMPKQPLNITVSNEEHMPEANIDLNTEDSVNEKTSKVDSVSSSLVRDASVETAGDTVGEEPYCFGGSLQRLRSGGSVPLNSMHSDTIEAAILDLEELAIKVKWLKSILKFGSPLSNDVRPSWKFVECRATSTPK